MSDPSKTTETANPEVEELIRNFITPVDQGYNRNRSTHPEKLDASTHRVKIDGLVATASEHLILELRNNFQQHEVRLHASVRWQ